MLFCVLKVFVSKLGRTPDFSNYVIRKEGGLKHPFHFNVGNRSTILDDIQENRLTRHSLVFFTVILLYLIFFLSFPAPLPDPDNLPTNKYTLEA